LGSILPPSTPGVGIGDVEIRFSPFGGGDEGIRKAAPRLGYRPVPLNTTSPSRWGCRATSVVLPWPWVTPDAYSLGLGMLEKVNHAQTMARYRREPDPDKEQGGGAADGMYLS
jgi:hypothetical protein